MKKENNTIPSFKRNDFIPTNNKNFNAFENTKIAIQNETISNLSMNKNQLAATISYKNSNLYLCESKIQNVNHPISSLNQDKLKPTEYKKFKFFENTETVTQISNDPNSNSSISPFISESKTIPEKLIMACINGNVKELDILVKQGADLSVLNKDGWSLLHIAVFKNKIKIVKYLLDHDLDINKRIQENGYSALEIACGYGYNEIVKYLLEKGANLYIETQNEYRLFQIAVENNKLTIVKQLVKKNIDVNAKDPNKWTALHIASRDNYMDIASYLINYCNANVNDFDRVNNTPLHIASQYGNQEIVQLLIINHADINYVNSEGWTPLHIASQYNNERVIKLLIDRNADVNLTTYEDWTPLHIATYYNNIKTVKKLLEKHPDLNKKTEDGLTALDIAFNTRNKEIYYLLLDHISKLDEEKKQMIESMHIENKNKIIQKINNKAESLINAVKDKERMRDAINLIISGEIGLEYIDKNGWTALHWACYNGNKKIVKLLIENNVKIDRKTYNGIHGSEELKGKTAMEIAMSMGHKDIANAIKIKNILDGTIKTFNIIKDAVQIIPFK